MFIFFRSCWFSMPIFKSVADVTLSVDAEYLHSVVVHKMNVTAFVCNMCRVGKVNIIKTYHYV